MYRELGQEGTIFGLRAGPYAGQPRTFRLAELPAPVLARLKAVVEGRARPAPILKREGASTGLALVLPGGLAAAALGALVPLAAVGFGQPGSLYQGGGAGAVYGACGAALALASWLAWRWRRALLPRSGVYLLPLDVVEVRYDQLTVTPLGGVRQVTIEGDHGKPSLVLSFDHGARHAFPVATEQDAERAHEHLERSQETLEHLTRELDLERALDADPFFSLRGTGGLGQNARRWELAARSPARLAAGWALVAAAGVAAGVGLWKIRNMASDQHLFELAREQDTPASYGEYLGAGRLHRAEAERWQREAQRKAEQARENRSFHEEEYRKSLERQAGARLDACEPAISKDATTEQALACYWRRATPKPEVAAWFAQRIRQGKALRVRFERGPEAEGALQKRREERLLGVLQRVIHEVAPMLPVEEARGGQKADLLIASSVKRGAGPDEVTYTFDVTMPAGPAGAGFRLTMPPPTAPLQLRIRSLYTLDGTEPRSEQLLTARAFDRLYDEVYGLFFGGDPRVPLEEGGGEKGLAAR
jgi:hypothetical protein